jgi:hypothetical protein
MIEWLYGLIGVGVLWLVFVVVGLFRQRIDIVEEEAEHLSGVIDVRRKAEEAKHNDRDAIKRMRERFNDP